MQEIKKEYYVIHQVLHDKSYKGVNINNRFYGVETSKNNGCRYIDYDGIRFMEQNKRKTSEYAQRAKSGAQITWGIRAGNWLKIET